MYGLNHLLIIAIKPLVAQLYSLPSVHFDETADIFEDKPLHLRENLLLVVMHQNVGLYLVEPLKHVMLDDFDLEKHRKTLLVVVEQLVKENSHHKHRAVVGLLTKLFYNVFVLFDVVLDPFDHGNHIFLILPDQMFVEHLWPIFFREFLDDWDG